MAKPAEKPMKEPKVPTYSQHISQLCLRLKITAWSAKDARASAMSFMPNQAASEASAIGSTDEAGVLQPDIGRRALDHGLLRLAAQRAEHAGRDRHRHGELHQRHAQVADAGVQAGGQPLLSLGKKKLMLPCWS